jgi:hypothetical protein
VNYGMIYRKVDVKIVFTYCRVQVVSVSWRISVYVHVVFCGELTRSPSES